LQQHREQTRLKVFYNWWLVVFCEVSGTSWESYGLKLLNSMRNCKSDTETSFQWNDEKDIFIQKISLKISIINKSFFCQSHQRRMSLFASYLNKFITKFFIKTNPQFMFFFHQKINPRRHPKIIQTSCLHSIKTSKNTWFRHHLDILIP
jgi:hypothetical protein